MIVNPVHTLVDAQFAVIGKCPGYGRGIISWHADEQSAQATEANLNAAGGQVKTIPTPNGLLQEEHAQEIKAIISEVYYETARTLTC